MIEDFGIAIDLPVINFVLPTEILKKILKNLSYKDLGFVKQTCKQWKEITDVFELRKQASSKIE